MKKKTNEADRLEKYKEWMDAIYHGETHAQDHQLRNDEKIDARELAKRGRGGRCEMKIKAYKSLVSDVEVKS